MREESNGLQPLEKRVRRRWRRRSTELGFEGEETGGEGNGGNGEVEEEEEDGGSEPAVEG